MNESMNTLQQYYLILVVEVIATFSLHHIYYHIQYTQTNLM